MATFSEIGEQVASGEIKTFHRRFPPILAGHWTPNQSSEDFDTLFSRICQNPFFKEHPFYLSVPFTAVKQVAEKGLPSGIIAGTQALFDIGQGSFLESVAVKLLKGQMCRFVVIDSTTRGNIFSFTPDQFRILIERCLEGDLMLFLCIGESYGECVEDQALQALKQQISDYLEGVKEERLSRIALIYSPYWIFAQGLPKLAGNIANSYHVIRHLLEEVLGEDKSGKIRVGLSMPSVREDLLKYIRDSEYEGFYFPDLSLKSDSFFKTVHSIQTDLPNWLETRNLAEELSQTAAEVSREPPQREIEVKPETPAESSADIEARASGDNAEEHLPGELPPAENL